MGNGNVQYILIADDNPDITDVLSNYVKKEGFEPLVAGDGDEALEKFKEYQPVVVLLDVMMPKRDGYEVCRNIRETSDTPVILVTARGEDFERIMGLDIGADDYIVKPFSPSEVMARVRAVLRRMNRQEHEEDGERTRITIGNMTIDIKEYSLYMDDVQVNMTKKELETVWTLANNPEKLFTRDNLLNSIWGYDYYGETRTVDTHIKRIRGKLDAYPHPDWNIKTVWGAGYKFVINKDAR
ncbi:MAG: response regulator transcription factor [Lachnospiraceae bacterium]|nr:response regulator transcription factor [Lachnospiraceae bacterium]MBR5177873.1 response regulator transcription factor [Lachnospiraceae bacterium]